MEPEKKTPEEEKKPDAPAAEQKDEPKPEEKSTDDKQADENGEGADKPDESKAEDKRDDKPEGKEFISHNLFRFRSAKK